MTRERGAMSDYETTSDLNEVIHYERLDADMLQAQYEAEGNAYARREARVQQLLTEGRNDEATAVCPHGGGYGLADPRQPSGASLAAQWNEDPRGGEDGFRCGTCGAHVTGIGGEVLHVH